WSGGGVAAGLHHAEPRAGRSVGIARCRSDAEQPDERVAGRGGLLGTTAAGHAHEREGGDQQQRPSHVDTPCSCDARATAVSGTGRSRATSARPATSTPGTTKNHGNIQNGGSAATASKLPTLSDIAPIIGAI